MTKYHINDYELLYLISEMNDYAFEILCMKYAPMIKRRFKDLGISQRYYDDFFQEGLIMLNKAVKTYKVTSIKSFNKYFDLILQRKFFTLAKAINKFEFAIILTDDIECYELYEETNIILEEPKIDFSCLSRLEEASFRMLIIDRVKASNAARILDTDERCIYNAVARAKGKLRKNNMQISFSMGEKNP